MVDARLLFSSGIGRYLREVLQRKPDQVGPLSTLCNTVEQADWIRQHAPGAAPVTVRARPFSAREQFLPGAWPANTAYWVPHYNVPWRARCRVIATVHDVFPLAMPELFGGGVRRWAGRLYFHNLRRRSQQVIAVSQFTRDELVRRQLIPAARVTVIPNGVSPFWVEGGPRTPDPLRLLWVGNLKPHKNLGRLLDAVDRVRRTRAVVLDIVGRIEGFRSGVSAELGRRIRSTPWVRLWGEVSDAVLRERYRTAGAYVFPSLYEGFGLPLLEALATGCPVISSRAGALAEVGGRSRSEGGAVDYFDPLRVDDIAAALERNLTLSPEERSRLQHLGPRIAADYSWDKTAAATWAVLMEGNDS